MQPDAVADVKRVLPRRALLSHLLRLHDEKGALTKADLARIAEQFGLSGAEVYEVASFYPALNWDHNRAPRKVRDLSCWLSCRGPGDVGAAWACRSRCANRLSFAQAPDTPLRPLRHLNRPVQDLIAAARTWPKALAIAEKWQRVIDGQKRPVLIVNADEGDPTACKDRFLLETDPQGVLEGALAAASALNACELIFYINCKYADAIIALQRQLSRHAAELSAFNISVERSGGAYICGEETALVASLEGYRGVPRERPYDLTACGFLGRPTLVHNVENLYRLSALCGADPEAGVVASRLFDPRVEAITLTGRVLEPGLVLSPWDGSLRDLIASYGGMGEQHTLAGAVVGGMLGGIAVGEQLDLPRRTLQAQGHFLGPGSVIAFSHQDSVREIVQIMLAFHAAESCGHCTPCRSGTALAARTFAQGELREDEIDDLAFTMREGSACGLGRGAGRFLAHGLQLCKCDPQCK